MADGVLLKHGAGFDNSGLTAVPADVKQPIKFLGAGSKEPQQGAMPVIPAITKDMAINERYNIVPGYHGGEDVFRQTGVKTETGQTRPRSRRDYVKRHWQGADIQHNHNERREPAARGNQGWCAGGRYCWNLSGLSG